MAKSTTPSLAPVKTIQIILKCTDTSSYLHGKFRIYQGRHSNGNVPPPSHMLTHPNSVPLACEQALQLWGAKQASREQASGKAPSGPLHLLSCEALTLILVTLANGEFAHRLLFPFLFERDTEKVNIKTLCFCFIFSEKKGCGTVMKAVVSYQCGPCSHPTADARVDATCGSSLLLVLFIALGNFSTSTTQLPLEKLPFQMFIAISI